MLDLDAIKARQNERSQLTMDMRGHLASAYRDVGYLLSEVEKWRGLAESMASLLPHAKAMCCRPTKYPEPCQYCDAVGAVLAAYEAAKEEG